MSEKDTGGKAAARKVRTRQERRERLKKLKVLKEARRTAREAAAAKLAAQNVIEAPSSSVASVKGSAAKAKPSTASAKSKSAPAVGVAVANVEKQKQRVIDALERDVAELSRLSTPTGEQSVEIERIRREVDELKRDFYTHLGVWQRVLLARHPLRPYTDDYIRLLFEDFSEIHGDRNFSDDPALITGMAKFHGRPVAVIGHQKGRDTKQRLLRNFGQPKPEGYRKALRVMELAAKYNRPVFTFIDTQGAYPGIDAEERGQAEAIAKNLREMARLPVPIIVTVTGEGGSGGALAIAVGDRVNILENSFYSVISPEGCAAIMWRDASKAETAAVALRITANDLKELGIVDEIVPEPEGGAHTSYEGTARLLDAVIDRQLAVLTNESTKDLVNARYEKFRKMGQFFDLGS